MMLPVAILAGGRGTRLWPLTESIPKCLVEIAGQPFLFHQFELLRQNGIERVVLCAGYQGEKVVEAVGDGRAFGLQVSYAFDGRELAGTGGALKRALPLLGDAFFVLYGDSYLEIDYRAVQNKFEASGKLGLMTVFRNDRQWDMSNVLLRDGRIVRYEKRLLLPGMQHIDYGLGVLRGEAFSRVAPDERVDLADLYQTLIDERQMAAFEVTRRFHEIGSFEGLEETRAYLNAKQQPV
jgi:N-acetyl-alpha-D-muramate 1-phosphate uridylyltransferase